MCIIASERWRPPGAEGTSGTSTTALANGPDEPKDQTVPGPPVDTTDSPPDTLDEETY